MSGLRLDYVALACRDPHALEQMLVGPLGLAGDVAALPGGAVPAVGVGEVTLLLFDVSDRRLATAGRAGLDHLGLAEAGSPTPAGAELETALVAGQRALDAAGGVAVRVGPALALRPGDGGDAVERIDHIGVASADNRAAEALFSSELGFEVESRQTDMEVRTVVESFTSDKYGVKHHARTPEAVGGLRVSFVTVGDCELEFLEEFDSASMSASRALDLGRRAGTTRQDQGAIGRFIERHGPGLHHLALKTPDIDRCLGALAEHGARLIDRVGRPGSRRARIGFVHPSATAGVLVHLVEREPLP